MGPYGPWDSRIFGEDLTRQVVTIEFPGGTSQATDADIADFGRVCTLRLLSLRGPGIGDRGSVLVPVSVKLEVAVPNGDARLRPRAHEVGGIPAAYQPRPSLHRNNGPRSRRPLSGFLTSSHSKSMEHK